MMETGARMILKVIGRRVHVSRIKQLFSRVVSCESTTV